VKKKKRTRVANCQISQPGSITEGGKSRPRRKKISLLREREQEQGGRGGWGWGNADIQ